MVMVAVVEAAVALGAVAVAADSGRKSVLRMIFNRFQRGGGFEIITIERG